MSYQEAMNARKAYLIGRDTAEDTIRARLTEPIDTIEEGLAHDYLTQPMREALAELVRFRDAEPGL